LSGTPISDAAAASSLSGGAPFAYSGPATTPGVPPPLPAAHSSPPLAFLLGFIPGVGAVYNGQYAKGLVHVVIFGLIISVLANGAAPGFEPLFGLLIPCFIFYMAFEAYHTARKQNEGQPVDEFSGLFAMRAERSRFPMIAILLILFGLLFLLNNLDLLDLHRLLRFWPALLIALGLYMLYERVAGEKDQGQRDQEGKKQ
jgi:hypothetical protein